MTRTMSISETGLRLIKAFEGFRPTDRRLVTGARVVGYGHRLFSDMPMRMSEDEAEERLKLDLSAYEEMVNDEVHAPLSQSQFDALCSLAFNIGPKAFRESDTLRALNNGRPLDAANGFDIWRKASIGGETYVVDALMRRRAAEKCLFLRTDKPLPAPGAMLEPQPDPSAPLGPTRDALPAYTEDPSAGLVAKATYDDPNDPDPEAEETFDPDLTEDTVQEADDLDVDESETVLAEGDEVEETDLRLPARRRDDDPVGILTLSETIEPGEGLQDGANDALEPDVEEDAPVEPEETKSPIAEAADLLSERLDKLLDDDSEPDPVELPDSLVTAADDGPALDDNPEDPTGSNLLAFPAKSRVQPDPAPVSVSDIRLKRDEAGEPVVIDDLAADDAIRAGRSETEASLDDADPVENAARYLE
ncbi:MAG: glycoside hydrolase family protein, partial [Litorimonas sp.]